MKCIFADEIITFEGGALMGRGSSYASRFLSRTKYGAEAIKVFAESYWVINNMTDVYKVWFTLLKKVMSKEVIKESINCPNCNQLAVNYQYIGDKKTNIGYLLFWCKSCLNGIHVSRVTIPKDENIIDFEDSEKMPKFNLVL